MFDDLDFLDSEAWIEGLVEVCEIYFGESFVRRIHPPELVEAAIGSKLERRFKQYCIRMELCTE